MLDNMNPVFNDLKLKTTSKYCCKLMTERLCVSHQWLSLQFVFTFFILFLFFFAVALFLCIMADTDVVN